MYTRHTYTYYNIEYEKMRTARSSIIGADRDDCRALTRPEYYIVTKNVLILTMSMIRIDVSKL